MRRLRPLSGPPPAEIPLARAPLVRVVSQVRFAPILAIRLPEKLVGFQEAIRSTYPFLSEERLQHIVFIAPSAMPKAQEGLIWRFADKESKWEWRVSLGTDFVALETTAYVSREHFLQRLAVVVRGVETTFGPSQAQRIGLRYVDQLTKGALDRIDELIRPKILGVLHSEKSTKKVTAPVLGAAIVHVMTEAQFQAIEGRIQARWGYLPEKATFDPDALEPIEEPSWVLDLDMFTTESHPFTEEEIVGTATKFAERVYAVFRETVTPEFLRYYGGQI